MSPVSLLLPRPADGRGCSRCSYTRLEDTSTALNTFVFNVSRRQTQQRSIIEKDRENGNAKKSHVEKMENEIVLF